MRSRRVLLRRDVIHRRRRRRRRRCLHRLIAHDPPHRTDLDKYSSVPIQNIYRVFHVGTPVTPRATNSFMQIVKISLYFILFLSRLFAKCSRWKPGTRNTNRETGR